MLRSGFADNMAKSGGGAGGREAPLISDSCSQQRIAKSRAHAVHLINDNDGAFLSILPDTQGRSVSLHRQLRERYNPTQIPLSSLSCAIYLGAEDIAQLAAVFRDFSLFSNEVIDSFDSDEGGTNNIDGKGDTSATAGESATKRRGSKGEALTLRRGGKSRPGSSPTSKSGAASRLATSVDVNPIEGKVGMGLLWFVSRPPPMSLTAVPEGTSFPPASSPTGAVAAPAGAAVRTRPPTALEPSRKAQGVQIAPMTAKMGVVGRCERSESLASKVSDTALSMGWLVELLLEMVIANSADVAGIGCGGGGAVSTATAIGSSQPPLPPINPHLLPGDNNHPTPSNTNPTSSPSTCLNISPTAIYQARRRDARVDQLCHFKAELTAWAEHLAQRCDERESQMTWQQCVVQEKVLQRYHACVLQDDATRPNMASFNGPSGGLAAGNTSRSKALSFANLEPTGIQMNSKNDSSLSPCEGNKKRGSAGWGSAGAAALSTSKGASQSYSQNASISQRPAEVGGHPEVNGAVATCSFTNDGGGVGLPLSPTEALEMTCFPFTGSMSLMPPNLTEAMAELGPPAATTSMVDVHGGGTDRSLVAVKAQFAVPTLRDLLQKPAQLYDYLWTSSAAARISQADGDNDNRSQRLGVGSSNGCSITSRPTSAACGRRNRIPGVQSLVCWSDVASNLLMGLETSWLSQRQEVTYVRVPTALFEDPAAGAASKTGLPSRHIGGGSGAPTALLHSSNSCQDEDNDGNESLVSASAGGSGGGGQSGRRRSRKDGVGQDTTALHQKAVMLNSLDAVAKNALSVLHAHSADHLLAPPGQRYLVTSSKDGLLKVWDTIRGQFISTILNVGHSTVLGLSFLHGGEFLMVATSAAEITIVNFPAGGVLLKLRGCTSLATAIPKVKQSSTMYTKRYGLKPGESGRHKPVHSESGSWVGAAAASRLMECIEAECEPIAARPIVGYVAPTATFYDAERCFLFFGTLSGMIGFVDMSIALSRAALHAAASGVGSSSPLHVHSCVLAHTAYFLPEVGFGAKSSTDMPSPHTECNSANLSSPTSTQNQGRSAPLFPTLPDGASRGAGVQVGRLFFCIVGHCIISCDLDGGIVRTPFAISADTLDYVFGTPTVVTLTPKPIRFLVGSASGRRFVTVHSDRRAFLWTVGRTSIECHHQYPQEAYDIVDVCFLPVYQQVALLTSDHSIRIYDEMGSRPLASIRPPRGLSSRVEDMASVTLKYSAMDSDGCLTYLPTSRRLVCGLRGPILYELVVPASKRNNVVVPPTAGAEMLAATDVTEAKKSLGPTDTATTSTKAATREGDTNTESAPPSLESSTSGENGLYSGATVTSNSARRHAGNGASRGKSTAYASASVGFADCDIEKWEFDLNMMGAEDEEGRAAAAAAAAAAQEEARRQRQLSEALHKCEVRLQPNQTHSSAVIGLLLDTERGELHSFSTETWCVWQYETGKRLRGPLHVPRAAERELALRGRRALLTCCSWSTEGRTRVLAGTRDSRVLTLDTRVGAVVSSTEPFLKRSKGLLAGTSSGGVEDRDISAMSKSGNRAVLCSSRVCEVRRYVVANPPKPTGEEEFICMRVELPSVASSVVPSLAPSGETTGAAATATASPRAPKSAAGATPGSCSDTTITACCVVRESHLCLGTADTQLFFYRMVDNSSPLHVEVLCDVHGVPDVGRVVSLNYLGDTMRDVLLAVVDTGILFVYSYTQQRTLGRFAFPLLGSSAFADMPRAFASYGSTRDLRRQEHYITCVSLVREVAGTPQLSPLMVAAGDSAGYVHLAPLNKLLAEVSSATPRDEGMGGAARAPRTRELRLWASFRASRVGVSSLELLLLDSNSKLPDSSHGGGAQALPPVEVGPTDKGGSLGASLRSVTPVSPSSAVSLSEPHLLVFAGGFDGDVRLFRLFPCALPHSEFLSAFSHANSAPNTVWPLLHPQSTPSNAGSLRLSYTAAMLPGTAGCQSFLRPVEGGGASLSSFALGAMRYEVTTVGLYGVDTWALDDPCTFSDAEQARIMSESRSDGRAGIVLPSILDDVEDIVGNMEEGETATVSGSSNGGRVSAAGVASSPTQDSNGVLLYDILRSSKKQTVNSLNYAHVANAQQPSHQPRVAAAPAGSLAEGATLLQGPSGPKSRSPPLPSSTHRISPATETAVVCTHAPATPLGNRESSANRGLVRCPGSCVSRAPGPEMFLRPPPPLCVSQHTIVELVRDTQPSSWNRSFTNSGIIAALSSTAGFPMSDTKENTCGGDTSSVLLPNPYVRPIPNTLVHVYPVSLLRHMGLLHPLDTTPDVHPDTGVPLLISAEEAFRFWTAGVSGAGSSSNLTVAPMAISDASMPSFSSVSPAFAPKGLDAVVHVPQYTSNLSSASSFNSSVLRHERRVTAVTSAVQMLQSRDPARTSTVEPGETHTSLGMGADDMVTESPVFLTEGAIEGTRTRSFNEVGSGSANSCSPFSAASMQVPASASSPRSTLEDEGHFAGAADRSQEAILHPPLATVLRVSPDATGENGEVPSRWPALSANTSTCRASASHSRHPVIPTAASAASEAIDRRKVTYLRSALKNIDADVLRIRSDQMMLSHIANQLDISRRLPPATHEGASVTSRNGKVFSSSTTSIRNRYNYTSQLMRLWRQRSGDAVVTAAMAAINTFGEDKLSRASTSSLEGTGTTTHVRVGMVSPNSDTSTPRRCEPNLADDCSPISEMKTSSRKGLEKPILSPRQHDLAQGKSSSRRGRQHSHGSQSNPLMAYASMLQASPSSAFGVELLTLTLPSEPQTTPSRPWCHASGRSNSSTSGLGSAAFPGRGPEAAVSGDSATAASSKAVPRLGTRLPMVAVQQEVQPIQVSLPSTLRSDEGERMFLRRFEAVFNTTAQTSKR